ncbi:hypothetical protein ACIRBY_23145 [Streptomyces sp. NPDC096136]|uniref:hypothetical protein n=1 Tax=Streptomyces sp. NPDC096136 TaxID=3366076 RepID=UPI00382E91B1
MTSPIPRAVMSLDTLDTPGATTAPVALPSPDLLDRARAGWEHFLVTARETSVE